MTVTLPALQLDWEGFLKNLQRQGTPERVFYFEHGIAEEIQKALDTRFKIWQGLDPNSRDYEFQKMVALHGFLGHELFRVFPPGAKIEVPTRQGSWVEETSGVITSWEDFEEFNWPSPEEVDLSVLEYCEKNLSNEMRVFHDVSIWEVVRDLFGFETFCYKLYEEPDLVAAVFQKVGSFVLKVVRACCDFGCYGAVYLSDDLGYKTSLMISPDVIRTYPKTSC